MLQQTQVAAVLPYYDAWMKRFPDYTTLATASEQDVLHAWQGLGYYARARNLRSAAQRLMREGGFPRTFDKIGELPGVGGYTARAIATFSFDHAVPIVEANTARLLSRLVDLQLPIDTSTGRGALWTIAAELVPKRNASAYNSALLDLGALVCCRRPKCAICPVKRFCKCGDPLKVPIKKARPATKFCTEHHGFTIRRGRVLLEQSRKRWRGMWMLPSLASSPSGNKVLHRSEFPFTHHRITLAVSALADATATIPCLRWFRIEELDSIPIPSPHRRALTEILATTSLGLS